MTSMVRLLLLAGYIAGIYFIRRYLQEHPPKFKGPFVYEEARPFIAFWYLSAPLLMPVLAFIWFENPPFSAGLLFWLFIILPPLVLFWPWLWIWGVRLSITIPLLVAMAIAFPFLVAWGWAVLSNEQLLITAGLLPALFFILAPPALMLFLLYIWGPEILPLSPEEKNAHRNDVARLLSAFWTTFGKPSTVIVDGDAQQRVAGNPFLGVGPGLMITEPENMVILRDGSQLAGIVDPGVNFVGYTSATVVEHVVDLFKQFRVEKEVEAVTKDGITIHAPISSIFSIAGSRPPTEPGQPWQYHRNAAFKACSVQEVNPEGRTPLDAHHARSWKDLPLQIAMPRLKQRLAAYTLDELYGAQEPTNAPLLRMKLGKEMQDFVKAEIEPLGLEVSGGGMGNKISAVDPKVTKQRIENWKATWMRKVLVNESKAQAAYLTQLGRVRGKVLSEMLHQLVEQSQRFQDLEDPEKKRALAALLNLRLMETLDEIARDPEVEPLLPEPVARRMLEMRKRREDDLGGEA